jgi:hypothetical protein
MSATPTILPRRGCFNHVVKALVIAAAVALTLVLFRVPATGSASSRPWLWQCAQIHLAEAQWRCYVRLLLADLNASRDPAAELPRIDRRARTNGGPLAEMCHPLMHEVGRRFAAAHRLTLATLQRYVPRSNDPNCSAGFGMGLVMYLGPQILRDGGHAAVGACTALPTRFRAYTCVHGLGHALMRAYHGELGHAVRACRRLGPRYGPDCAQGAFHDYWISLRGADGTTRPAGGAVTSPRILCDGRLTYVRPCWYRYFLEQAFGPRIAAPADLRRVCRGLRGLDRSGCIAGATLTISTNPFDQAPVCDALAAGDAVSCFRGVAVQALAGHPRAQLRLARSCGRAPAPARPSCYAWLGRTLAVVTNGRFARTGCPRLSTPAARTACTAGARRMNRALVTFS